MIPGISENQAGLGALDVGFERVVSQFKSRPAARLLMRLLVQPKPADPDPGPHDRMAKLGVEADFAGGVEKCAAPGAFADGQEIARLEFARRAVRRAAGAATCQR